MPRLLAFLPCERVVIAKDDGTLNLFTVMAGLKVGITPVPTEDTPASLPVRWSSFAYWLREPADEGRRFEQQVQLVSPTGAVLISQGAEFVFHTMRHRQTGVTFGFPLVGEGTYKLTLSLRESEAEDFSLVAEYPIEVTLHNDTSQAAVNSGASAATTISH